jgi:peroxiredoxin
MRSLSALLARFVGVSSQTDLSPLGVGTPAPDFTLRDQFGQDVTLSSFAGHKAVALVFFPWAFSNVCTNELTAIRDTLDEWLTFDTEVLAVSTDPTYSLRVFADTDGLNFPLLSDFWPHGAVASAYGVFDSELGVARRSSFVVDRAGVVRWSVHNQLPDGRDLGEHLAHLHHLA